MELPKAHQFYRFSIAMISMLNLQLLFIKPNNTLMFRGQSSNNPYTKDDDIEQLKILISALIRKSSKEEGEGESKKTYKSQVLLRLQEENRQLKLRIKSLTNQNKQIIREMLNERQQNSRLKYQITENGTKERLTFDRFQKSSSKEKAIISLEPSRKLFESELLHPQQPSPSILMSFNEETSNYRDQLYRLNSNLIEYNTNIKLLIEKYNYLHKLRGLSFSNDPEELKVIHQTNQIFSNRKQIEEAHVLLQSSRKKYFGSDTSSDIEEQLNQIEAQI